MRKTLVLTTAMSTAALSVEPKPKKAPVVADMSWRLVRAEGRPADVVQFEESVVAFFLESADILGVPKSVAALYGICFASPEPLGYSEIQARLNLSAGSISQGLKALRAVGALKVVRLESENRELMTPDLELRKLIQHWLTERLQRQLAAGEKRIQDMMASVPPGRTASAKELRERIKSLRGWHSKASAVLPFVQTALKLG